MMMRKAHYILILLLTATGLTRAQSSLPGRCATMEVDSMSRARFPRRGTLGDFEQALQRKIQELTLAGRIGRTEGVVLNIPIIVHVVHNGESAGSGMNISQAQIQSQIAVLNEDFRRKVGTPGFNNHPSGADIEIEFCLSPVDENGVTLSEPGIHRYNGNKTFWTKTEIENQLKPSTIWNPNLFYNIWTVKFGGVDSNLLGYAQFPDQSGLGGLNDVGGPASTDGVVIRYTSFGKEFPIQSPPYNKGRTLSHETGHWLGLRHIWGDGPCASDFVSDTPTAQSESYGCATGKLSCDGLTPAMVQNYMDYSDDACMNIFTQGQKTRILAVMDLSPRRKSLTAANLCSPIVVAAPTANFTSDKQSVLLNGEVNFTDLSTNFPTSWSWIFEGGDPGISTARNPKIKYNTAGVYKVSLIATNSVGPSATLEKTGYITVSNEGLCSTINNYKSTYTNSIIAMSDFGAYTGKLTGHNSLKPKAISEFFANSQGYEYVSSVQLKFGYIQYVNEDATVTVTVWNARGPQSSPGSVVERKTVSYKQIKTDFDKGAATTVTFDRETPLFGRGFHVGVELTYSSSDQLAISSSANGEATNSTSWIQSADGVWSQMAIAYGANIAMNIKAIVGVKLSTQISSNKTLIYPGEEVILNGRGASVFIWSSDDGKVSKFAGPQLIVNPAKNTTYTVLGSGLDLCNATASTTIFVRDVFAGVNDNLVEEDVSLSPNPGQKELIVRMQGAYKGAVKLGLFSIHGEKTLTQQSFEKLDDSFELSINTENLSPGIYIVRLKLINSTITKKWIKY